LRWAQVPRYTSFIKIGSGIRKLIEGGGVHRQQGHRISLLIFFSPENHESGLNRSLMVKPRLATELKFLVKRTMACSNIPEKLNELCVPEIT
jgi:hypothetical protein